MAIILKMINGLFANLPIPDVVYNRIHSRKSEHTALFKKFRSSLERFGIPLFNHRFLSKLGVSAFNA